jgi:hypothetical protein
VHELAQVEGQVSFSNITLLHYAHRNIAEFFSDVTGYAKLAAEYQNDSKLPSILLTVKTIVFPLGKFIQNYFLKLGFLDGWRGLTYATLMSLHSLSVRVMSYENA